MAVISGLPTVREQVFRRLSDMKSPTFPYLRPVVDGSPLANLHPKTAAKWNIWRRLATICQQWTKDKGKPLIKAPKWRSDKMVNVKLGNAKIGNAKWAVPNWVIARQYCKHIIVFQKFGLYGLRPCMPRLKCAQKKLNVARFPLKLSFTLHLALYTEREILTRFVDFLSSRIGSSKALARCTNSFEVGF
jgi:hypothetical protein